MTFWVELLDRYLGKARAELGPEAAAVAWEEGRILSLERTIDEAFAPPAV